jgi:hypothetical protein
MVMTGIPLDKLRHTRAAQQWLAQAWRDVAAAMTLRLRAGLRSSAKLGGSSGGLRQRFC